MPFFNRRPAMNLPMAIYKCITGSNGSPISSNLVVFGRVKITENTDHLTQSIAHNAEDPTDEFLDIDITKFDNEIRAVLGCASKMKIKIALLSLMLITALGVGSASAEAKSKPSAPEPFHVARTPAEKALDDILRRADQDKNIFHYVLGTPFYDAEKDSGYARLFTKNFLRAAAKKESDAVKRSCDGKYTGEICGLDSSPINCAQDISESGYLHRTMEDDGRRAIISSMGVDFAPEEVKTSYRLIKDGNRWRLDGVACGGGGEFNMECGGSMCPDVSDLRKKAGQGDADAQYDLGVMYNIGRGVNRDYVEAARWFRKAAGQGHAGAQSYLGYLYEHGYEGVTQDNAEAARWYRKAAEQGHADAQYYLGDIYEVGRGVTRDDAESARWHRKAAEQGQVHSQHILGLMYDKGRGVTRDLDEAARWYRKAAEKGDSDAQYSLGMMHRTGMGVQRDLAEAEMWLRKAAERGHAEARQEVEKLDRR
ncbi:MAG: sel1 repeat family protein [Nitrospinae bacterium]|nr:sel1 repeat family protein [Nitrospinota bacterium]